MSSWFHDFIVLKKTEYSFETNKPPDSSISLASSQKKKLQQNSLRPKTTLKTANILFSLLSQQVAEPTYSNHTKTGNKIIIPANGFYSSIFVNNLTLLNHEKKRAKEIYKTHTMFLICCNSPRSFWNLYCFGKQKI